MTMHPSHAHQLLPVTQSLLDNLGEDLPYNLIVQTTRALPEFKIPQGAWGYVAGLGGTDQLVVDFTRELVILAQTDADLLHFTAPQSGFRIANTHRLHFSDLLVVVIDS